MKINFCCHSSGLWTSLPLEFAIRLLFFFLLHSDVLNQIYYPGFCPFMFTFIKILSFSDRL